LILQIKKILNPNVTNTLAYKIFNQTRNEIYNLFFGIPSIKYKFSKYFLKKKKIFFNNRYFYYDNKYTPILLDNLYSDLKFLKKFLKKKSNIMDIGANVGQFSIIIKYLFPYSRIEAFEPNKIIFPLLKKNISNHFSVKAYNYALGNFNGIKKLYFIKNKSAQGSIYKKNCQYNLENKKKLFHEINIKRIKRNRFYDLIKIDTEGYELKIIKSIKFIKCKYLYIENSENIYPYLKNNAFISKVNQEYKMIGKKISLIKVFKRNQRIFDNFFKIS
jgi:FkbM family methyltransferase